MSDQPPPNSEIILYQTEDGRTRIQCRFEHENVWMTQALMAELFQVTVPTVNEHLKGIYAEGELAVEATIRKFRIVRFEGARQVAREIEHYNLEAITSGNSFSGNSRAGETVAETPQEKATSSRLNGFVVEEAACRAPGAQSDVRGHQSQRQGAKAGRRKRKAGAA